MITDIIRNLNKKYKQEYYLNGSELCEKITRRNRETLIALMQGVIGGILTTSGKYFYDVSQISSEVRVAFTEAFPNMEIEELAGKSVEYLDGIAQGWKGKLFEVTVKNKLNTGEEVGGIILKDGQIATLASSPNQPEWDLQILDLDGNPIRHLQLKATENMNYIVDTLEKYPDTEIITTAEISSDEMIFSTDITDLELESFISDGIEVFSDGLFSLIDFTVGGFGTMFIIKAFGKRGFNNYKITKIIKEEIDTLKSIQLNIVNNQRLTL